MVLRDDRDSNLPAKRVTEQLMWNSDSSLCCDEAGVGLDPAEAKENNS